jgi:CubicO group peptidase (beta-lactamase class C family)
VFRQRLRHGKMPRVTFDTPSVQALLDRAAQEVEAGTLPSCQLALARDGKVQVVRTFGAPDSSRYVMFSVTKALTAAGVWGLLSDGLLTADTRVADVVPGFAAHGKQDVTVAHVMTHTAGFPRAPMRPEDGATSAGRLARFAAWRLDWEPGTQTAYHVVSAHWVLAEVIEQLTGADYRAYLRQRVLDPLGLRRMRLGAPAQEQGDVLDVVTVGEAPADGPAPPAFAAPEKMLAFNDPVVREIGIPGAGGVSDAADVALLYQAFLHNPSQLWDPAVLADATGTVRNTWRDPLTGVSPNRTLGLAVAGDDGKAPLREFGRGVGPRAFGAPGIGGQIAWADPDTGLSFCYLTNGMEANIVTTFLRSSRIATLAARCADGQVVG